MKLLAVSFVLLLHQLFFAFSLAAIRRTTPRNHCFPNPCMGGGKCYDRLRTGLITCACPRNRSGERCEFRAEDPDPCVPNPCRADEICIAVGPEKWRTPGEDYTCKLRPIPVRGTGRLPAAEWTDQL